MCDPGSLKAMREQFGARFTPFYKVGDFNHDGRQDFALVLVRDRAARVDTKLAESHRYRYDVRVVVFNGERRGGYRPAFERDYDAPLVCFLALSRERRSKLTPRFSRRPRTAFYSGTRKIDESDAIGRSGWKRLLCCG